MGSGGGSGGGGAPAEGGGGPGGGGGGGGPPMFIGGGITGGATESTAGWPWKGEPGGTFVDECTRDSIFLYIIQKERIPNTHLVLVLLRSPNCH